MEQIFRGFCHAKPLGLLGDPLSKKEIPLNHWVHLRCRRQGCKDRNRQHRQPAWAFSQDAIPEDSDRPAAASVPWSQISSLWLCYADSLDAIWLAAEGGTARHSGKSAPRRRPTRALRLPIEVPIASPTSWRYSIVTIAQKTSNQLTIVLPTEFLYSARSLATFYITSENYCTCISERKFSAKRFFALKLSPPSHSRIVSKS